MKALILRHINPVVFGALSSRERSQAYYRLRKWKEDSSFSIPSCADEFSTYRDLYALTSRALYMDFVKAQALLREAEKTLCFEAPYVRELLFNCVRAPHDSGLLPLVS